MHTGLHHEESRSKKLSDRWPYLFLGWCCVLVSWSWVFLEWHLNCAPEVVVHLRNGCGGASGNQLRLLTTVRTRCWSCQEQLPFSWRGWWRLSGYRGLLRLLVVKAWSLNSIFFSFLIHCSDFYSVDASGGTIKKNSSKIIHRSSFCQLP